VPHPRLNRLDASSMAVHLSGKPASNIPFLPFGGSDRDGAQMRINNVGAQP
jgi:hypothetical protein